MVGVPDGLIAIARVYICVQDTRYLSIYVLGIARRIEHFDSPKLGGLPPTSELIILFFVPLTTITAAFAVTSQLGPIGVAAQ